MCNLDIFLTTSACLQQGRSPNISSHGIICYKLHGWVCQQFENSHSRNKPCHDMPLRADGLLHIERLSRCIQYTTPKWGRLGFKGYLLTNSIPMGTWKTGRKYQINQEFAMYPSVWQTNETPYPMPCLYLQSTSKAQHVVCVVGNKLPIKHQPLQARFIRA